MIAELRRESRARQRLGLRQSSAAFGPHAALGKAPEDWRSPKPCGASYASRKVLLHGLESSSFCLRSYEMISSVLLDKPIDAVVAADEDVSEGVRRNRIGRGDGAAVLENVHCCPSAGAA